MDEIWAKHIANEPDDSPCKNCNEWKNSLVCGCSKHKEYMDLKKLKASESSDAHERNCKV